MRPSLRSSTGASPRTTGTSWPRRCLRRGCLPSNDLPLDRVPPDTWLPGVPRRSETSQSYNRVDLTLDEHQPQPHSTSLDAADTAKWNSIKQNTASQSNCTSCRDEDIGAMTSQPGQIQAASNQHGIGTCSVSLGNISGLRECLVVLHPVRRGGRGEARHRMGDRPAMIRCRLQLVRLQPRGVAILAWGQRIEHRGPGTRPSQRGQTSILLLGNGISIPSRSRTRRCSAPRRGPGPIVTVGAVHPTKKGCTPGPGSRRTSPGWWVRTRRPTELPTVSGKGGGFSGEPRTPHRRSPAPTAGRWTCRGGRSPDRAGSRRTASSPPGPPSTCGEARPDCELGDGVSTAPSSGPRPSMARSTRRWEQNLGQTDVTAPPIGEDESPAEGHGYFAKA